MECWKEKSNHAHARAVTRNIGHENEKNKMILCADKKNKESTIVSGESKNAVGHSDHDHVPTGMHIYIQPSNV